MFKLLSYVIKQHLTQLNVLLYLTFNEIEYPGF